MQMSGKTSYKEELQELLYDPDEEELCEIRFILKNLYADKNVVDEDGTTKVVDLTAFCLIYCEKCGELQPHTFKNYDSYNKAYLWAYCDDCGWSSDFEIRKNI